LYSFRKNGWDSRVTPELLEKDPPNRLLARGPRLRVEGEMVRDIALSASGLLDPTLGGPSIFTPVQQQNAYAQAQGDIALTQGSVVLRRGRVER
jgi:hypothetical protein